MEVDDDDPKPFKLENQWLMPFKAYRSMFYIFVISFPTFLFWFMVFLITKLY